MSVSVSVRMSVRMSESVSVRLRMSVRMSVGVRMRCKKRFYIRLEDSRFIETLTLIGHGDKTVLYASKIQYIFIFDIRT